MCELLLFKQITNESGVKEEMQYLPSKVLWYLSIIHKFRKIVCYKKGCKRFYMVCDISLSLICHKE